MKGGHVFSSDHFRGKSSSDSKKGQKSTRRQRKLKTHTHVNKYE